MKMLKRWIAFGLVMILLAGVAFDHSSLIGSQVEAADLTEPEAAAEADTAAAEASVLPETEGDTAQTESNTEAPAEEPQVTETPQAETEKETPAEEVQETTQVEKTQAEAPKSETAAAAAPELKTLNFENDDVTVTVSEVKAGAIPEGASLQVVPILADNKETEEQYKEVEEQIQKDAAKTGDEVKGFLAYDISFVDPDGNEVEPNSEVKVTMEYKEPALPTLKSDTEIKDAEVSVLHLEEDKDGNIQEVVDMNETNQVESMELGDSRQVKKVELTTDSFSIYTIEWKNSLLQINVVDSSGNPLNNNDKYELKYNWEDEKRTDVRTIAENIKEKQQLSLAFNKAVYVEEGGKFQFTATQIYGFIYKEENKEFWYCSNENIDGGNGWTDVGDGTVYFIFGDDPELKFDPIETVSTKDTIDINLFDYQVGENGNESADWNSNSGINKNHALKFVDTKGEDHNNININQVGSSGHINSGMVQSKLNGNGFPILSKDKDGSNGEFLDYLFDDTTEENVKSKYTGLDYLFKIDNEGYHVFNSDENYAYLNNDGNRFSGNFTVGNILGQDSPGFYPFSQPTSSTILDIKNSSNNAMLNSTGVNHYYGMTIETSFIQPKGGKINNQDMIFEFSGDDDVWVFIDDVLVLDLGGIHGEVSGTINFATGEVTRTDIKGTHALGTNIKDAFDKANVETDFESGTNTFSDYSTHTIKFFYLERGNYDSNCMIKFNFPTIPKDSVSVAKEVTDEKGEGLDYAKDIDFEFNIKVNNNNYANENYSLWENGKQVVDESGNPVTGTTDKNGNFTLKHTQMAVFSDLKANDKYKVTELGAYLDGYQVFMDDTVCEITSEESGDETVYKATTTEERTVGADASVVFKNAIEKTATINIKKELADGEESTNKVFQIRLKIQGVEYKGSYSINNESGPSTDNGIISLQANETASISGLPYGVNFEVEEILDGSYLPTYSVSEDGIYDYTIPSADNDISAVTGKLNGTEGTVTVTNSEVIISDGTTAVTVTKTWDDDGKYSELIPDSIIVTLYEDTNHNQQYDENDIIVTKDASGNNIQAEVSLTSEDSWTYTWSNLPADTDFVITETYPEGFEWKTTEYSNSLDNLVELDRVTSCKNLSFDLGKNNMLLVKNTKNDGYFLWSVYDLKLTDAQIQNIAQTIKNNMDLEGDGNLDLTNLGYDWGITSDDTGITLTETAEGWNLKFEKTNVWSQFWNFQYNRTENISLVNQIDQDLKTAVTVNKDWGNYSGDSVTVELIPTVDEETILTEEQIQWAGDFTVILDDSKDWKYKYDNLPFYYYDSTANKYKEITYSVTETNVTVDGKTVELESGVIGPDGYVFDVTANSKNNFTITNNKISEWEIVKVSSTGNEIRLEGAEFTLTKQDEQTPKYYGRSDSNGIVKWYDNSSMTGEPKTFIDNGVYSLEETKAPEGYHKSGEKWNLKIENYQLKEIKYSNGQDVDEMSDVNGKISYAYINDVLYALPESGGPGIYWYLFGGVLLMMAASLIVYKNKRREVLKS